MLLTHLASGSSGKEEKIGAEGDAEGREGHTTCLGKEGK